MDWVLLFWLSVVFVAYTYIVYPLVVAFLASRRGEEDSRELGDELLPTISFIMAAFNEEHRVAKKIENILELDYPTNKIEIILSLDGCTDRTKEIAEGFEQVKISESSERKGKPSGLNRAVALSKNEVLVFTDLRQKIDQSAVRKIVSRLVNNDDVGAVSAELVQMDEQNNISKNVGLYWKYEKWIRSSESAIGSVPGVTGALYCIAREDFIPINEEALLDDFEVPVCILKKGKKIKFQPEAYLIDNAQDDISGENQRKIRTLMGNFQSFAWHMWLFNPLKNPIWIQFLSHKVFRLFVPYCLALIFISSLMHPKGIIGLSLIIQLYFYGSALVKKLNDNTTLPLASFALVFVSLNWCAVIAFKRYILGETRSAWTKTS